MTGPEHYKKGEELLADAEAALRAGHMTPSPYSALAAAHFAAAQAAAAAREPIVRYLGADAARQNDAEWSRVL